MFKERTDADESAGPPPVDSPRDASGFVDLGNQEPVSLFGKALVAIWVFGLVVIVAVGVAHVTIFGNELARHEIARAQERVEERVDLVVEPAITAGLLAGNPEAYAEFDALVRRTLLRDDTAGLALWTPDGTVVYSLDPAFVGQQFELPPHVETVVRDGSVIARHGPLDGPGDEVTPGDGEASSVEVYAAVDGPDGQLLVWEADLRRDDVSRTASRLVLIVAVMEAVGTLAILTAQGLFGRSLVRRHDRERAYRRWLTQRAAETALVERRRIAADIHDGVVQDLTGLALDVSVPAAHEPSTTLAPDERAEVATRIRAAVTSLRAQTTELYPVASSPTDLPTGLRTLLDQAAATTSTSTGTGIDTGLRLGDPTDVAPTARWLVFRVAQEAVRNAVKHSHCTRIDVAVRRDGNTTVLTVDDDGIGFSPAVDSVKPGHMGLALLADMAAAAGGSLAVRSSPGAGTTVRLEVPR